MSSIRVSFVVGLVQCRGEVAVAGGGVSAAEWTCSSLLLGLFLMMLSGWFGWCWWGCQLVVEVV